MTKPVAAPRKATALAFAAALIPVLAACDEANDYVQPPPPKVTVAQPLVREVIDYLEFTGTTETVARVEIQARVPGILRAMTFQPGTRVDKGDPLFEIDPSEYDAEVAYAKAELASAKARGTETKKTVKRAADLIKRGNVSQAKLDEAQADALAAEAEILSAQAKLTQAKIRLGYTKITAPIDGRVGRNKADIGNLVGEGEATVLTEITQFDPIHVYFEISERDLLRLLERFRALAKEKGVDPRRQSSERVGLPVFAALSNEEDYVHEGVIDYSESTVDSETGTLQLRGKFANPGGLPKFLPGLFVRLRLPIAKRPDMALVSERAIGTDQGGPFLLVVTAEKVVEKRPVRLGHLEDGLRVIEEGVKGGELVVVNGLQRARPGAKVDPKEADMASLTTSALRAKASDK